MPDKTPHGQSALRWLRVVSWLLLLTACVIVAMITFSPGPPDPDGQLALQEFLLRAYQQGLPIWITFAKIEFAANILMFIPIGFFGALCLARFRWLIIPIAIAASTMIEIAQSSRLPDRVGTPRDVVANSLGALIGFVIACLVVALARRLAQARATQKTDPSTVTDGTRVAGRSLSSEF
jgi:glycopeptide antibiotics resistance protein